MHLSVWERCSLRFARRGFWEVGPLNRALDARGPRRGAHLDLPPAPPLAPAPWRPATLLRSRRRGARPRVPPVACRPRCPKRPASLVLWALRSALPGPWPDAPAPQPPSQRPSALVATSTPPDTWMLSLRRASSPNAAGLALQG